MKAYSTGVSLKNTKYLVEQLQQERGFTSFSKALRFIIKDYFKLRNKLDEAMDSDFEKVCDLIAGNRKNGFNAAVAEDLDQLKQDTQEIKYMILVISAMNPEWKGLLKRHFPGYFLNNTSKP